MKNFNMLRCRSTMLINMLHLADINFGELQKHVDAFHCLLNIKILFHRPGKTRIYGNSSSVPIFERELY